LKFRENNVFRSGNRQNKALIRKLEDDFRGAFELGGVKWLDGRKNIELLAGGLVDEIEGPTGAKMIANPFRIAVPVGPSSASKPATWSSRIRKGTWTASNAAATRLRAPESGSIGRYGIAVGLLEQLLSQRQAGSTEKDFTLARKRVQGAQACFSGAADQRRELEGSAQLLSGRQAPLNFEEDLPGFRAGIGRAHNFRSNLRPRVARGTDQEPQVPIFSAAPRAWPSGW
jgi:hypothetical protein